MQSKVNILEVLVTVMEEQIDELYERIKSIEIQLRKEKTHG
jgi:hypothetical protein|tara:strand:+ start:314 stop:436 length:123 start_codon:yes stop_codon:yes gene_type:complete